MKIKDKRIGFGTFYNTSQIVIPLEKEQGQYYYANIILINANQDVLSMISTGNEVKTRNYGGKAIAASLNNSNLEITLEGGGVFWGGTLVIVNTNYNLSWGG